MEKKTRYIHKEQEEKTIISLMRGLAGLFEGMRAVVACEVADAGDEHLAERRVHIEEERLLILFQSSI